MGNQNQYYSSKSLCFHADGDRGKRHALATFWEVTHITGVPETSPCLKNMKFAATPITVSFHNSKSQHFKLSVSNPKSKSVACVSVLSQISNCQGLGRKNKFKIMKTDRSADPT